jgi:LysR family transcriptional activator of nhaA
VEVIGRSDELCEEFYAISVERRLTHPCVVAITQAARADLFGTAPPPGGAGADAAPASAPM